MDERQEIQRAPRPLATRPAKSDNENVVVDVESAGKASRRVMPFRDAQSALNGMLQAWLPRLVESNGALEEALMLLRDLHFASQAVAERVVLKKVEDALAKAEHARRHLLARCALVPSHPMAFI
jgi:hypothetical protein